ncbi:hypothetical protein CK203_028525 [Vitis vinifera]|uniref:Reverse transcriptase zinc-binding domain-containing protein n=1 Tax=Vitis vinifera TaxID=29760 RepID=A0A438I230_VITVI|nr:hypothetical protein CK203_028525 [Vitis vinifera]
MERNVEVGVLKKLGKGMRVSFWKDKWCGAAPLCDSFPALFAIATFKEALVEDVWIASENVKDRVRWGESKDGTFSVMALYKALESDSTGCFPMKIIWNSSMQPKRIGCFLPWLGKPSWGGKGLLWGPDEGGVVFCNVLKTGPDRPVQHVQSSTSRISGPVCSIRLFRYWTGIELPKPAVGPVTLWNRMVLNEPNSSS